MASNCSTSKLIRVSNQTSLAGHPEVVERLTDFYNQWWSELEPTFSDSAAIYLDHPNENPARLTSHDWITTGSTPWNQRHIREATTGDKNTGFWNVNVVANGDYEIRLRRWPQEADQPIDASLPAGKPMPGQAGFRTTPGVAIHPIKATIQIANVTETIDVMPGAKEATFNVKLTAGKTRLAATFETADGAEYGAYYVYVRRK